MNKINLSLSEQFMKLIKEAEGANNNKLRFLRKKFIFAVDKIGAKQFVTIMADILKNKFCIEGCNDARIPLKRIFAVSLDELEGALSNKEYALPYGHPVLTLSKDHKENLKKLKMLNSFFENMDAEGCCNNILNKTKDYFSELDLHIKKEEEILSPLLEKYGMKEHPDNLKEEHKSFRQILSELVDVFEKNIKNDFVDKIQKFKDKFISDISNHIFRETYVFYPAALEFIVDKKEWEKIKEGFSR